MTSGPVESLWRRRKWSVSEQYSVALGRHRDCHDLADAFVEQKRLSWSKEWDDPFKTHSEKPRVAPEAAAV
jgi:hypothetical protein